MSGTLYAQSTVYESKPGNGLVLPTVVREVKPGYTAEAKAEEDPGIGLAEASSSDAKGDVTDVVVTKSLDAEFGLDEAAIEGRPAVEIQARHERRAARGRSSHIGADLHPQVAGFLLFSGERLGLRQQVPTPPRGSLMQRFRGLVVTGAALLLLASPAFAGQQDAAANSSTQSASSAPPPDFMLGRPRASIGARGSFLMASANSDIFDFVTEQLAIDKADFNSGSFGLEAAFSLSPRFDIVGAMDLNGMSHASDYRLFEDNLGLPIRADHRALAAQSHAEREILAVAARPRDQPPGVDSAHVHSLRGSRWRLRALRVPAER